LNWDIVDAMSTVKELTLRPDGTVADAGTAEDVAADAEADEDAADAEVAGADVVDEDDEQPAAIRAATPATATQPNRESGLFLLPSCIPYTFRRIALGYADAGHRRSRVSLRDESRCFGDWTSSRQTRKKLLMNGARLELYGL
jgi:hypothetical protein